MAVITHKSPPPNGAMTVAWRLPRKNEGNLLSANDLAI